ncbi:hypothetical protein TTRE_0000471201 [Trichuris trichiura]|uniref:Uncharacterized protein n=1 Tax=Trichuris trichiura TaxID=36087 RepID=A0A077Z7G7_TRITR|nr:hypothetical protein TTRE_0000471201 [Trichuris trichiura]
MANRPTGEQKAISRMTRNRQQNTTPNFGTANASARRQTGLILPQEITQLQRPIIPLNNDHQTVRNFATTVTYEYKSETVICQQNNSGIKENSGGFVKRRLLRSYYSTFSEETATKNKNLDVVPYSGNDPEKKKTLPQKIMDIVKQEMPKKTLEKKDLLYEKFCGLSEQANKFIDKCPSSVAEDKDCIAVAKNLEKFVVGADYSSLYANKKVDELTLKELRMLKGNAYVGLLLSMVKTGNESELLTSAIVYMARYMNSLKRFGIYSDPDATFLIANKTICWKDYQKHLRILRKHQHKRQTLLMRLKVDCDAEERIAELRKLPGKKWNQEALFDVQRARAILRNELLYYAHFVFERLMLAKCKLDHLEKERAVIDEIFRMMRRYMVVLERLPEGDRYHIISFRPDGPTVSANEHDSVEEDDDGARPSVSSFQCPCQLRGRKRGTKKGKKSDSNDGL